MTKSSSFKAFIIENSSRNWNNTKNSTLSLGRTWSLHRSPLGKSCSRKRTKPFWIIQTTTFSLITTKITHASTINAFKTQKTRNIRATKVHKSPIIPLKRSKFPSKTSGSKEPSPMTKATLLLKYWKQGKWSKPKGSTMSRMRSKGGSVRMRSYLRKIFRRILMIQSMMRTHVTRICHNMKRSIFLTTWERIKTQEGKKWCRNHQVISKNQPKKHKKTLEPWIYSAKRSESMDSGKSTSNQSVTKAKTEVLLPPQTS